MKFPFLSQQFDKLLKYISFGPGQPSFYKTSQRNREINDAGP